ncbi:lipopolysaccharide biosynthesis protein [Leifsonia aquatica]|uniref:lipopolysaccharide biosynthesis protein n=1 Tax=Leifsonia aquatica TaxID=144185 RepID=UPI0037F2684C
MTDDLPAESSWLKMTSWLLVANLFRNLGLIAILVLLARFTDETSVGHYSLALAINTPIFVFAEFGMRTVYLTLHREYRFSSYTAVRVAMIGAALVVGTIVALFFPPEIALTIVLVAAVKFMDSLSDLFSAPLQKYNAAARITRGYFVGAVLGSAVVALTLWQTRSLNVALLALLGVSTIVALGLMWPPARRLVAVAQRGHLFAPRRTELDAIVRAGLPTGVSWAMLALVSTTPQYFLAPTHGAADVGRFAIILYVLAAVELFLNALSQSWIPTARAQWASNDGLRPFANAVARVSARWTVIFVPLGALGALATWLLLPLVFGASYALTWVELLPLTLCVLSTPAVFFGAIGLTVRNLYLEGIVLSTSAAVASIVMCAVLIGPFGIAGALWATFIAYCVRAAAAFVILYRSKRLRPAAVEG